MIRDPVVMLDNLVLSFSDSLDLIHPCAVDHQQRVAYLALRITEGMGYRDAERADLLYAAALHDIGILSVEEKIESMRVEFADASRHVDLGVDLLRRLDIFARAAEFVRFHHQPWADEAGWEWYVDGPQKLLANAIHLADVVDRIVRRDVPVLRQVPSIVDRLTAMAFPEFSPVLMESFRELAGREAFWLDFASPRIYSVLTHLIQWPRVLVTLDNLEQIGQIFSRIVDFRSRFTATHSIGVATAAVELARRLHFGERECRLMRIAGHLHDLGKVAVPNRILDKPDKLDTAEFDVIRGHTYHTYHILSTIGGFEEISMWASHHHERLNGRGYPFHLTGDELPLGSRIMAVADVFTAAAESRAYRKGTGRRETVPILESLVRDGGLDARVVRLLVKDFDEIDRIRAAAQEAFAAEYAVRVPAAAAG